MHDILFYSLHFFSDYIYVFLSLSLCMGGISMPQCQGGGQIQLKESGDRSPHAQVQLNTFAYRSISPAPYSVFNIPIITWKIRLVLLTLFLSESKNIRFVVCLFFAQFC